MPSKNFKKTKYRSIIILSAIAVIFLLFLYSTKNFNNFSSPSNDDLSQSSVPQLSSPQLVAYPSPPMFQHPVRWQITDKLAIPNEEVLRKLVDQSTIFESGEEPITYVMTHAQVEDDWVVLYGVAVDKVTNQQLTGIMVILAQYKNGTWQLTSQASPDFCVIARRLPRAIIGNGSRPFMCAE